MEGPNGVDQLGTLAMRFARAVETRDRSEARACCTPSGLMFGETPAALFLDAVEHGYGLEVAGEARVSGGRGAVPVAVVKAGHAPREVWLLGEEEDGQVGLAGVTGSRRIAEAFLAGVVPANAALSRLPESSRGARFGAAIVEAFARHGKVAEAFGGASTAARAAGWMLDAMLASPGAQISVSQTRELAAAARAAVCFEVSRPELSLPEDFWVVLELADGHEAVQATASSMSLEVLLSGVTGVTSVASHAVGGEAPATKEAPFFVPDRIDELLARLEAALGSSEQREEDAAGGAEIAGATSPLDQEAREHSAHDAAGGEALRELLDQIVARLPERAPEEELGPWLRRLLGELVDGLGRTLEKRTDE